MSTSETDYIETVENLLTYDIGLRHGWIHDYIGLSTIYDGSVRKFAADLYRYTRNTPLIKDPFMMLYYLDAFLITEDASDLAEIGVDKLLIKCCAYTLRNTPKN